MATGNGGFAIGRQEIEHWRLDQGAGRMNTALVSGELVITRVDGTVEVVPFVGVPVTNEGEDNGSDTSDDGS